MASSSTASQKRSRAYIIEERQIEPRENLRPKSKYKRRIGYRENVPDKREIGERRRGDRSPD